MKEKASSCLREALVSVPAGGSYVEKNHKIISRQQEVRKRN